MRCHPPIRNTIANDNDEEAHENEKAEEEQLTHSQKISKINAYISFEAAYLICLSSLPYTAAENLLKPGFKAMLSALKEFNVAIEDIEDVDNFVDKLPLSDTTISRRVNELGTYLEAKTIEAIKNSPIGFSLQADESTDIDSKSQLSVFVRFVQF